jgi:hypothetical protein
MIDRVFCALITTIGLMFSSIVRPERVIAPVGWYVEGVRPTGETVVRPSPPPNCEEPVPPHDGPCPPDDREIGVRVHCTGGTRPIVVNERVVGCQPGGWP